MPIPVRSKAGNGNPDQIPRKENVTITFVSNTGLVVGAEWKPLGFLCELQEMGGPVMEIKNERDYQFVGKNIGKINDGMKMADFSLSFAGASVREMGAIIGQNTGVSGQYGIYHNGVYNNVGHVIVRYWKEVSDIDTDLVRTDLYLNLSARVLASSGTATDATYDIQLFNENAFWRTMEGSKTIVCDAFFDNQGGGGTVVNTNAPDGALQFFGFGAGNYSYLAQPNPNTIALDIGSGVTGVSGYFQGVFAVVVDGVLEEDPNEITVANAAPALTNGITFANKTPADGAVLLMFWGFDLDGSDLMPNWRKDLYPPNTAGTNGGEEQSWSEFVAAN